MPETRLHPRWLLVAITLLTLGVLTLDLQIPLGVAVGVAYISAMLLALWLPGIGGVLGTAAVSSCCVLIGYAYSPAEGLSWVVLSNRLLSLGSIWAIAFAGYFLKRSEAELSQSETRYRSVAEMGSDGIIAIDRRSIVGYANDQANAMFGFGPRELTGQSLARIMDVKTFERHSLALARYLDSGERHMSWGKVEVTGQHRDGSAVPHLLQLREYQEQGKRFFIASLHDLRKQKRLLATLKLQEWELGERSKEIDCLYQLSLIISQAEITPAELCAQAAEILPAGWQYPDHTRARVRLDKQSYNSKGYSQTAWCQQVDLRVNGKLRGGIDICYTEQFQDADEGPFLKEERALLDEIAKRLGNAIQRREAEIALVKLNAELEGRVAARTSDLQALNHELDAFAYSVSHDLRAPLRNIDGFSQALLEDYSEGLDPQACHYLERIRSGTQRMGTLIDDLLTLSRTTRMVFKTHSVNLSSIATEILAGLQTAEPERLMEIHITPDLRVQGDPSALVIVLQNLLANAWKYTGKTDQARIELGIRTINGEAAYFVSDNGVGFDMAHAGRLFSPFERLLPADEFPGSGIGLATVERLIHRHGGRIWAEAEVDKGACFYFTMGSEIPDIPQVSPGK